VTLLLFGLPGAAIAVTASASFPSGLRTAVWSVALTVMGIACVANAARCQRVHCYVTGPFFLVMAAVTLLYGLGEEKKLFCSQVGRASDGWGPIGMTILIGAVVFCCLPETLLGRYRRRHSPR